MKQLTAMCSQLFLNYSRALSNKEKLRYPSKHLLCVAGNILSRSVLFIINKKKEGVLLNITLLIALLVNSIILGTVAVILLKLVSCIKYVGRPWACVFFFLFLVNKAVKKSQLASEYWWVQAD